MHPWLENAACAGRSVPAALPSTARAVRASLAAARCPQAAWEPPCSAPGPVLGRRLRKRGKSSFLIPASDSRKSVRSSRRLLPPVLPLGQGAGDSTDLGLAQPLLLPSSSQEELSWQVGPVSTLGGLHPQLLLCHNPSAGWAPAASWASCIQLCWVQIHIPAFHPFPSILLLLNLGITSSFGYRTNGLNPSITGGWDCPGQEGAELITLSVSLPLEEVPWLQTLSSSLPSGVQCACGLAHTSEGSASRWSHPK